MMSQRKISLYLGLGLVALLIGYFGMAFNNAEWEGARIANKNAEARGGLNAWREVRSMTMIGKLDAGKVRAEPVKVNVDPRESRAYAREAALKILKGENSDVWKTVQLPYNLDLKRPRKSRLEIEFNGDKAVQVYDGEHGWKLRPFLGRKEVEAYTADEAKTAMGFQGFDGYLIDHSAKDTKVELVCQEVVEGEEAEKLKLTLKDGQVRYLWVDAKTHLEVKMEESLMVNGKAHIRYTFFRDYKSVNGLMIPHLIETSTNDGSKDSEKILIEKVVLNPKFEDSHFAKPNVIEG
jgi:hypothetical protein